MNDIPQYILDDIKVQADRIRAELRTGRYCGFPIDENNPDMMLVAAYGLAELRGLEKSIHDIELMKQLGRAL